MMLSHDVRRLLEAAHAGEAVAERVRVYRQETGRIEDGWIIKIMDRDPEGKGLRQIELAVADEAWHLRLIYRDGARVKLTAAGEQAWRGMMVTA